MDTSVSPKDEICFLRVCHHISKAVYYKPFNTADKLFSPYHFSCYWNQLIYPEDGGSTFFRNVGIFSHYSVQKPKKRPSSTSTFFLPVSTVRHDLLKNPDWQRSLVYCIAYTRNYPLSTVNHNFIPSTCKHSNICVWQRPRYWLQYRPILSPQRRQGEYGCNGQVLYLNKLRSWTPVGLDSKMERDRLSVAGWSGFGVSIWPFKDNTSTLSIKDPVRTAQ
jgi:hypothetical protein